MPDPAAPDSIPVSLPVPTPHGNGNGRRAIGRPFQKGHDPRRGDPRVAQKARKPDELRNAFRESLWKGRKFAEDLWLGRSQDYLRDKHGNAVLDEHGKPIRVPPSVDQRLRAGELLAKHSMPSLTAQVDSDGDDLPPPVPIGRMTPAQTRAEVERLLGDRAGDLPPT